MLLAHCAILSEKAAYQLEFLELSLRRLLTRLPVEDSIVHIVLVLQVPTSTGVMSHTLSGVAAGVAWACASAVNGARRLIMITKYLPCRRPSATNWCMFC